MSYHRLRPLLIGVALLGVMVATREYGQGPHHRLFGTMIAEAPRLIDRLPKNDATNYDLHQWFKSLTKAGYQRDADRMARAIKDPTLQSHALSGEVSGLFELQRMTEARDVAQSIPDPTLRDQNLHVVSLGFAVSGIGKGSPLGVPPNLLPSNGGMRAVETAKSIGSAQHRSTGLVDTARTLRIVSEDRAADVAAGSLSDPSAKDQAQTDRATILAVKRQPREALRAVERIKDPGRRMDGFVMVAGQLAGWNRAPAAAPAEPGAIPIDGEFPADPATLRAAAVEAVDRALSLAKEKGLDRANWLTRLVQVLAMAGRSDRAAVLALEIVDPSMRNDALTDVVESLIRDAHPSEALKIAKDIPDPPARCRALIKVAEGSVASGSKDVAAQALELLRSTARTIDDLGDKTEAFREASGAFLKAGRIAEAVEAADQSSTLAQAIKDPERRAFALAHAVQARAQAEPGAVSAGRARQALEVIAPTADPYHQEGPLQAAARALLQALPDEKAVETASSIQDLKTRALVLTALADILGGFGWDQRIVPGTKAADAALSAAQAITSPAERSHVLGTVIEIAARADRISRALAAAKSIPDEHAVDRSQALVRIARIQAERLRFDDAWQIAQACSPREKLSVYATIFETFGTNPKLRRFSPTSSRDH